MKSEPVVSQRTQREVFIKGQRAVAIERRFHPKEGEGWCSMCDAVGVMDGVLMEYQTDPQKFYFFCLSCVRRLAQLL